MSDRLSPGFESSLRVLAAADSADADTRVHRSQLAAVFAELDATRKERDEAQATVADLEAAYGVSVAEASALTGRLAEIERVPFSLDGADETGGAR